MNVSQWIAKVHHLLLPHAGWSSMPENHAKRSRRFGRHNGTITKSFGREIARDDLIQLLHHLGPTVSPLPA